MSKIDISFENLLIIVPDGNSSNIIGFVFDKDSIILFEIFLLQFKMNPVIDKF